MAFDFAQTFFLDPSVVREASDVGITAVELYFRGKPKRTNNKSGIVAPGVTVSIAPCIDGVPILNELSVIRPQEPTEHGARFVVRNEQSRKEWGEIQASSNATVPTVFRFERPVRFKTGFEYAIVIKYDGHEDYILWFSRQGDDLVGTNVASPGPNGKYIGRFFQYVSPINNINFPDAAGYGYSGVPIDPLTQDDGSTLFTDTNKPSSDTEPSQDYLNNAWRPIPDIDLKFRVYCARYSDNGVLVTSNSTYNSTTAQFAAIPPAVLSNNVIEISAPIEAQEFILFDRSYSNTDYVRYGDWFFQEGPHWPGGTSTPLTVSTNTNSAQITANSAYLLADGTTFNASGGWNNIFTQETDNEFIVLHTANGVFVRKIKAVVSNTVLRLDENVPVTDTVATFQKTAVGVLVHKSRNYVLGVDDDICILANTNANSTVRFVNNALLSIGISAPGSGYSNSDYIVVSGFENVTGKVSGGYNATANIVTNGSGVVTAVHLNNTGCGFVNTSWLTGSNVVVNNSSGSPSSGTGFTPSFEVSSRIRSELSAGNTFFSNIEIMNLNLDLYKPEITVDNPVGTSFEIKHGTLFYEVDDDTVFSGKTIRARTNTEPTEQIVKIFKDTKFPSANNPVMPSRSNQFVAHFANGSLVNNSVIGTTYSNAAVLTFETSSNNDFTSVFLQPEIINSHYSKYVINNDYTDEHTNYGNAYAKHLVTKVSFQEDRFAEDLLVYLTCYRPLGTDFKVYARMHNSKDPEPFDDKDYTLLEQTDGINVYSSQVDDSDYIELTYGIPLYPNAEFTQVNAIATVLGNTTVTSSGFDSRFANNDLVRIYNPLFPDDNYIIDVIQEVVSATEITLENPIANDGVVGTMSIERVGFPKQMFKNETNNKVARYYNSDLVEFDTYDSFQIKVVMVSNNQNILPNMDDIRAIAVTA
jgi:hypothetical protein